MFLSVSVVGITASNHNGSIMVPTVAVIKAAFLRRDAENQADPGVCRRYVAGPAAIALGPAPNSGNRRCN
jgi:hypothetical protein